MPYFNDDASYLADADRDGSGLGADATCFCKSCRYVYLALSNTACISQWSQVQDHDDVGMHH